MDGQVRSHEKTWMACALFMDIIQNRSTQLPASDDGNRKICREETKSEPVSWKTVGRRSYPRYRTRVLEGHDLGHCSRLTPRVHAPNSSIISSVPDSQIPSRMSTA